MCIGDVSLAKSGDQSESCEQEGQWTRQLKTINLTATKK